MKILVTGSTQFIGSHLVEELAKQGLSVRASHAPHEKFKQIDSDFLIDGLDLESFPLDITNRQAVFQAMQGIQILFHAETLCSFHKKNKEQLYAIHQTGTRNLLKAALACGVEKVVYTAGPETLMVPPGQEMIREEDGVSFDDLETDFEKSRYLGEREVQSFKQKGLPIVIVHPTFCLGSRDRTPSPFGAFLLRYLRRKTHFYLDTGFNLIDVVDVAKGHLLAAKRGKVGGRYILGNYNAYMLDVLQHLEPMTGIPAPKTAVPISFAKWANLVSFGSLPLPNPILERLKHPLFFDTSLAKKELGLPQSNIWEAMERHLSDLHRWFL
jgi:dihydroflavonol-4-reductase